MPTGLWSSPSGGEGISEGLRAERPGLPVREQPWRGSSLAVRVKAILSPWQSGGPGQR